jgi:hypothetical protein
MDEAATELVREWMTRASRDLRAAMMLAGSLQSKPAPRHKPRLND